MLRLVRRSSSPVPLELDGVTPDRLLTLSPLDVANLPVAHGNRSEPLGDHFTVSGDPADGVLHLHGDLGTCKRVGEGMTAGTLVVEGDVGLHAGARMAGGTLLVHGTAGDYLAAELRGGTVEVRGDAGDGCAAGYRGSRRGMTGGVVLVRGDVGAECGLLQRRGLIVIGGRCGPFAGAAMIAGTLVSGGGLGRGAGAGLKRGTLLAPVADEVAPGFRYSCDLRPTWLPLLAAEARRLGFDAGWFAGEMVRCHRGDVLTGGNGELLLTG